jgi:hypothetical protein
MSSFVIPPNNFPSPQVIVPTVGSAALLIRTAGLGILKTEIYRANQPTAKAQDQGLESGNYRSLLGTLVFSNLDISGGSYTDNNGVKRTYDGVLIDTVLFKVGQQKHIVKTAIQGRNGTVKEYVSDGDYSIVMEIVINGGNGVYPKEAVNALIACLQCTTALTINSWFIRQYGITEMVVDYYEQDQVQGSHSSVKFRIQASSDTTQIITLT